VVDPVERPVEILLVVEQKDFFADERLYEIHVHRNQKDILIITRKTDLL